jgi:hypothetical protein
MKMTKKQKHIVLISIMICCFAAAAFLFVMWWIPNQKMAELNWWENASKDELRKVSHQVLRYPIGNHHDAFIVLEKIGNAESVPLLIRALKWQDPPGEDGFTVCTLDHCLSALRSLTGVDQGTSFKAWSEWWKNTGSKKPLEAFYPRIEK